MAPFICGPCDCGVWANGLLGTAGHPHCVSGARKHCWFCFWFLHACTACRVRRVGPHDPEQRIPRLCAIPAAYLLFLLLFRVPMSGIAGKARGISAISQVSILGIAGIADLTIPGAISPTSESPRRDDVLEHDELFSNCIHWDSNYGIWDLAGTCRRLMFFNATPGCRAHPLTSAADRSVRFAPRCAGAGGARFV